MGRRAMVERETEPGGLGEAGSSGGSRARWGAEHGHLEFSPPRHQRHSGPSSSLKRSSWNRGSVACDSCCSRTARTWEGPSEVACFGREPCPVSRAFISCIPWAC